MIEHMFHKTCPRKSGRDENMRKKEANTGEYKKTSIPGKSL